MRKRKLRNERRKAKNVGINLVSLMDIFTILVFFLLVNSSDVETLSSKDGIELPESISETKPKETIIIIVSEKHILVQGRKITDVSSVLQSKSDTILALKKELEFQLEKSDDKEKLKETISGNVTIMGDRKIPYRLLKKIMLTCAQSNYGNISLAVEKKVSG